MGHEEDLDGPGQADAPGPTSLLAHGGDLVVRLEPGDGREVHQVAARLHQPGVAAKALPCLAGKTRAWFLPSAGATVKER